MRATMTKIIKDIFIFLLTINILSKYLFNNFFIIKARVIAINISISIEYQGIFIADPLIIQAESCFACEQKCSLIYAIMTIKIILDQFSLYKNLTIKIHKNEFKIE